MDSAAVRGDPAPLTGRVLPRPSLAGAASARLPQLDGLRGVAVLLVVFCHAWDGVAPVRRQVVDHPWGLSGGGLFGVQLFFVLSGFLITGLLLGELDRTGRLDYRAFYLRRARRLLPAFLVVVGVYVAYVTLALRGQERLEGYGAALRALLYIEDLGPVAKVVPSSGWLVHTWSLAVEEQFYLLWPVVLVLALRRWGRPGVVRVAVAVIVLTVLSRHLLVLAEHGQANYFLLRWDALMLGALLAVRRPHLPRGAGPLAFAVLLASAFYLPPGQAWVFTFATLTSGVALLSALQATWLTWGVLRYAGRISYGLYLWHVLLLRFGQPVLPTLLVSVAVAAASYRYVEAPFLRARDGGRHAPREA